MMSTPELAPGSDIVSEPGVDAERAPRRHRESAQEVVERLYGDDATARAHGIRIESVAEGRVEVSMVIRPDMTNGAGVAHGGWAFSLADTAFAYAAATVVDGVLTTGADIRFHSPAPVGTSLRAEAIVVERRRTSVMVDVVVRAEDGHRIASFRGDGRAPRVRVQPHAV